MRSISNTNRSVSVSSSSGEDGDTTDSFTGDGYSKNSSIRKANTVPIDRIFRYYGVNLNKYSKKATCPFKSHKGGRENSASFVFYPDTNSYCCFGCRQGSRPVDFVSIMDNITRSKAAVKILDLFGENFDENSFEEGFLDQVDFSEQLEIMMSFSNEIRDFRKSYIDNESLSFIENICKTYDDICLKHELDNEALRALVEKLQRKIDVYKLCLTQ